MITYVPEAYSDPESGNSWGGVGNMNEVFFADVDGDQRSDMCFAYHDPAQGSALATLRCHLSTGTGFGGPTAAWTSAVLNPGNADYPRTFADVNGDGAADFCRTLDNGTLRCLLGSESGFTATDLASAPIDRGYKEGAAFIDANGDGKTDYCRITGSSGSYRLRCTYSTGVGWDTANERVSPVIPNDKVGHAAARWWIDINADGLPDFCRAVGTDPNSGDGNSDVQSTLSCRLNKGDGSSSDAVGAFYYSDIELNANFARRFGPRQWCDPSGSGFRVDCFYP